MLAQDYATKRTAFGSQLCDKPLHLATLASMRTIYTASLLLTLDIAKYLGDIESSPESPQISETKDLMRLLTPLGKLYTGKAVNNVLSETIESFGGIGYLESSGIPQMARDAQVLAIWEGTTNVLSLDVLRVFRKHPKALDAFSKTVHEKIKFRRHSEPRDDMRLSTCRAIVVNRLHQAVSAASLVLSASSSGRYIRFARDIAMALAKVYAGACMVENAEYTQNPRDALAAHMFIERQTQDSGFGTLASVDLESRIYGSETDDDAYDHFEFPSTPSSSSAQKQPRTTTFVFDRNAALRALALGAHCCPQLPTSRVARAKL
mmetsp:Transcript_15641/g.29527  ORF Transcript_15641/g.29527 Transcript_15641/m.29527 type:complete len:320 (-) Transcript_15641:148-1107(-)